MPAESVAPTQIAELVNAGSLHSGVDELPAAATVSTPFSRAYSMASRIRVSTPMIVSSCPPGAEPRERLMTSAPLSAAHRIPSAMSCDEPVPASRTLTGRTLAPGATPAMPMPLPAAAATMPATCVPCSSPSFLPSGPLKSPLPHGRTSAQPAKVAPGRSWPTRSGWSKSTPVSTTATTAPLPVPTAQAASALIWSRPHCLSRRGSPAAACAPGATATSAATTSAAEVAAPRSDFLFICAPIACTRAGYPRTGANLRGPDKRGTGQTTHSG